jgi:hypothetical protein
MSTPGSEPLRDRLERRPVLSSELAFDGRVYIETEMTPADSDVN